MIAALEKLWRGRLPFFAAVVPSMGKLKLLLNVMISKQRTNETSEHKRTKFRFPFFDETPPSLGAEDVKQIYGLVHDFVVEECGLLTGSCLFSIQIFPLACLTL